MEARPGELRKTALYFGLVTLAFFAPVWAGRLFLPLGFLYRTPLWYDPAVPLQNFDLFDAVIYFYPVQTLLADSLAQGVFPLWNPYNLGGHPVAFNGQSGFFYPPRVLLLALLPTWLAFDLSLLGHMFVAGLAASRLGRALGQTWKASLLCGTAWMLNPFLTACLPMDHQVIIAALLPLGLLAVLHCRVSWRGSVGVALALAGLLTCGHLQLVANGLVAGLLIAGVMFFSFGVNRIWPGRVAAGGALGFCLAAPSLLPTAILLRQSQRPELSLQFLTDVYRQFLATCWPTLIFPEAYGNPVDFALVRIQGAGNFTHFELMLYFGVAVLFLALTAAARPGMGRALAVLAVLVLLLPATWLYAGVRLLPGFEHVISTRWITVVHFLVVLASGFGVDALTGSLRRRVGLAAGAGLALALVGVARVTGGPAQHEVARLLSEGRIRLPPREVFFSDQQFFEAVLRGYTELYSWTSPSVWVPLLLLGLFTALCLSRIEPGWPLLALVLLDLGFTGLHYQPIHPARLAFSPTPEIRLLQSAEVERVLGLGTIKPNTLLPFKILDAAGYDSFYPRHSAEYLAYLMRGEHRPNQQLPAQVFPIRTARSPLVDLLGVRFLVGYPDQVVEGLKPVGPGPLKIYENPTRLPRAFVVGPIRVEPETGAALDLLASGAVDPRREALVAEPLKLDAAATGKARIVRYRPNAVTLEVESTGRALLVLTDAFAQGWQARVDGRPQRCGGPTSCSGECRCRLDAAASSSSTGRPV